MLDETRRYVQAYQAQRQRTANISSRLSEIQAADKTASERIEHTILLFQQATLLVNSNAFLTSVTAGEPARLKSELTAAANELRQPSAARSRKNPARRKWSSAKPFSLAQPGWKN